MYSTHQRRWDETGDTQSSKQAWQHWGALVGGSALAVIGMTRRSKAGWALAAAGGAMAYSGLRAGTSNGMHASNRPGRPELGSNILVNASPQDAFRLWRDLENAPRFMNHIESVTMLDERRSRWTAVGPMGAKLSWTAEITDERPGEYIAWRSLPGSDLECGRPRRVQAGSRKPRNRRPLNLALHACQPRVAQRRFRLCRTTGELLHAPGSAALQGAD